MVVTGIGWVAVISTLDARAQVLLPDWPQARALAYYQLVVMGRQAVGSVLWGAIAEWWGTTTAFTGAAAELAATVPVVRRFLRLAAAAPDLTTVRHPPEPPEVFFPRAGRVLVTVEWGVPTERAPDFVDAMVPVGRARRRTGARLWASSATSRTRSLSWKPSPWPTGPSICASTSSAAPRWTVTPRRERGASSRPGQLPVCGTCCGRPARGRAEDRRRRDAVHA
ncbi:hypothetical protein GCM10009608_46390 [Pseudonocardia alaniniphila]